MLKRNLSSMTSILALTGALLGSIVTSSFAMNDHQDNPNNNNAPVRKFKETVEAREGSATQIQLMNLSDEVILAILEQLSPKTLSKIASVSRKLNRLSKHNSLWNRFLTKMEFEVPYEDTDSKFVAVSALRASTVNLLPVSSPQDLEALIALGYTNTVNSLTSTAFADNRGLLYEVGYDEFCNQKSIEIAAFKAKNSPSPKTSPSTLEESKAFDERKPLSLEEQYLQSLDKIKRYDSLNPSEDYKDLWRIIYQLFMRGQHDKARGLIERLADAEYPQIIREKAKGLDTGFYGYDKDPKAARFYIEKLLAEGTSEQKDEAITVKIEGLANGNFGYDKDPEAARHLNEQIIAEGSPSEKYTAIYRKYKGLLYGNDGYKKNQNTAFVVNELLVRQGDPLAIHRKILRLVKVDPTFLKRYLELLAD